jgi:hypothetical protein
MLTSGSGRGRPGWPVSLGLVAVAALLLAVGAPRGSEATRATALQATPGPDAFDLDDVLGALWAAGLAAEETGQPIEQPFLDVPGQIVDVEGEDLQVYIYSSADEREADLRIAPDGSPDPGPTTLVDWVANPHAYGVRNVLALFVSDDEALATAIERGLATLDPEPGPVVTPVPGETAPGPVQTIDDVVAALESAGLTVEVTGAQHDSFFSVPAQELTVEGEPFEVYIYPTAADRVHETEMIRGDGSEVGPVIVDWIAPPHWAAANNVLTLLVSADDSLVERVAAAILTLA